MSIKETELCDRPRIVGFRLLISPALNNKVSWSVWDKVFSAYIRNRSVISGFLRERFEEELEGDTKGVV